MSTLLTAILPAYTVDPFLGKVDKSCLSQLTLMELFVEGITNTECIWGGEYSMGLSEWFDIDLNASGEVIEINWDSYDIDGTINLQWLPPSVVRVHLDDNNLTGSIDLTDLPQLLKAIFICQNTLSGTISLESLPPLLVSLGVSENQLTGTVNLTLLPTRLQYLFLYGNMFFGPIDITKLPEKMLAIHLNENQFEGDTDFSQLPPSLNYLAVANTKLSGTLVVKNRMKAKAQESNVTLVIQ
uniref:Leucine-rich repeat protein n=1 Tax=Paramoeba aestuarina TaxID=180227 RepID=A0A7S4NQH1_9EUKA|mmetsp:Transcript_23939/g.37286  ORF Transcript_23939/g.37286 Transcript_23939/m.37286 type:complete len:241 (+) Transcript_23939:34-756(+)